MSDGDATGSRISLSEDKLRALFAEFKLEIVDELKHLATAASVEMLDARVKILELWQANILGQNQSRRRISDRALAYGAVVVSLVGSVVTLIWLNHG